MYTVKPLLSPAKRDELTLEQIMALFDSTFFARFNTRLIRGGDEPLYLPADSACTYHRVIFARGFLSSALHEIAHWCLAGEQRRKLVDYGYWYLSDGRDAEQQAVFEQAEVKPQAIEWAFHQGLGLPFNVSCDNLGGSFAPDHREFRARVQAQLFSYQAGSFPIRAERFIQAISDFSG